VSCLRSRSVQTRGMRSGVLGDSPALAEDGVGAIALDIEELPPVPDRHASERREILLFEEAGTNAAMIFTGVKGDAEVAFRDADYVRRDRFIVQRYTALPMERPERRLLRPPAYPRHRGRTHHIEDSVAYRLKAGAYFVGLVRCDLSHRVVDAIDKTFRT